MYDVIQGVKILHFGNVFLDCPFTDLDLETSRAYRMQKRQTLRTTMEWARDNSVQLILITGDLVDNSYATLDTLKFLIDCFSLVPDCHIVITPGAHDFIWTGSIYRMGTFPKNVTIFDKETPTQVVFPDIRTTVTGWGFCSEYDPGPILRARHLPACEGISVVAGYGAMGPGGYPNAVAPEDIAMTGADYVALTGPHLHGGFHKIAGRTVHAYSGALENSGYGEPGVGGANVVQILMSGAEHIVTGERMTFGTCLFATEELEVTGVNTAEDILERLRLVMQGRGYDHNTALRVIFCGQLPVGIALPDKREGAARLGLYAFDPIDETLPACQESLLARDMTVLGELSRNLIPQMKADDPAERRPAADAMRLALLVLSDNHENG